MPNNPNSRLGGELRAIPDSPDCIYVIDDNREVRQSLALLLDTLGIAAWSFASAREFLDRQPSLPPAPLLLDITMPGMSGIELLEVLAERRLDWPVLIMTGLSDASLASRALALGAIRVLEKPFSAELLEDAVRTALALMTPADGNVPGGTPNATA